MLRPALELAHYAKLDAANASHICNQVVLGVLAEAHPEFTTAVDLSNTIKTRYGFVLSEELVLQVLRSELDKSTSARVESRENGTKWRTITTYTKERSKAGSEFAANLRRDSIVALGYSGAEYVNYKQLDFIVDCFIDYVIDAFETFGAQIATLVNPALRDAETDQLSLDLVALSSKHSQVPEEVRNRFPTALLIICQNIPDSFECMLDTAIAFKGIVLSNDNFALATTFAQGCTFILDTNCLYRIVGFASRDTSRTTIRLLEASKKLGFKFCYTFATEREFEESLDRRMPSIRLESFNAASSAVIQVLHPSDVEVGLADWVKEGGNAADFVSRRGRVFDILNSYGVHRMDKDIDETISALDSTSEDVRDEISAVNSVTGMTKHFEVVQHDAILRILTRILRGQKAYSFDQANYFVLSAHERLLIYDRIRRRGDLNETPYLLTLTQLAFVLNALYPQVLPPRERREAFSSFFRDFAAPKLVGKDIVPFAREILAQARYMSSLPTPMAARLAMDGRLKTEMARAGTDEQRIVVFEEALNRISIPKNELNSDQANLIATALGDIKAMSMTIDQRDKDLKYANSQIDAILRRGEQESIAHEKKLAEAERRNTEVEAKVTELQLRDQRREQQFRMFKRWLPTAIAIVIVSLLLVFYRVFAPSDDQMGWFSTLCSFLWTPLLALFTGKKVEAKSE